jgi:hypothetical protein
LNSCLVIYSINATCFGRMSCIYFHLKMVVRPKHVAVIE